jgi:hypothetical protein
MRTAREWMAASVNSDPSIDPVQIDERQLCPALDGVRFPAPKWQLLACADYNGVCLPVREALWRLPERVYRDVTDVAGAVKEGYRDRSPGWSGETRAESVRPARSPHAVRVVSLIRGKGRPW